jgi:hypothetical protein
MSNKLKENSFDGAPGGMGGTLNYSVGYGTPNPVEGPNNRPGFETGNKNIPSLGTSATSSSVDLDRDVEKLFTKKETPTPDEIAIGLNLELSRMVKKDKQMAKEIVIKHLKENPKYYSSLQSMNINDDEMKVDETKKLLDKMLEERKKQHEILPNQALLDILNQKIEEKEARRKRNWERF